MNAESRDQVQQLKAQLDLVEIVGQTVKLKRQGRAYLGPCPFHDNQRTPAFAVFPDTQTWHCFGACAEGGDVFSFVMKRDGLTFREAWRRLETEHGSLSAPTGRPSTPKPEYHANTPPSAVWQAMGWKLIERAEACLWGQEGQREVAWEGQVPGGEIGHERLSPRAWLHTRRMLTDETLRRWRFGLIPGDAHMPFRAWGLPDEPERPDGLWLPAGIVIPTFTANGHLWAIHVRRWGGKPKYPHIRGSKKSLWGTQNLDRRVVLGWGGELDGALAQQVAGEWVGCCSPTTGEGSRWSADWTIHMLGADAVLVGYDADAAGQSGAWKNVLSLTSRAVSCPPPTLRPGDKDITDYVRAGGDLAAWVKAQRDRALAGDRPDQLQQRLASLSAAREKHPALYFDLTKDYERLQPADSFALAQP